MSGVDREITVKGAEGSKGCAKLARIAAVKVASAVRVGKERVTGKELVFSPNTNASLGVTGGGDHFKVNVTKL